MDQARVNLSWRAVATAAIVIAVACLIGLIAVAAVNDAALETTALVLAVIAFVADLVIALASYMIAANAEARSAVTNAHMQTALGQVNERTEEIRHLVRLQGERMLDMVGQRVLASSPPEAREGVEVVLNQLRSEIRDEPVLLPPDGGRRGRREHLFEQLTGWVKENGYQLVGPERPGMVMFKVDKVIYALAGHAGPLNTMSVLVPQGLHNARGPLAADWAEHEVKLAVLVEEPNVSRWDGKAPAPHTDSLPVVTLSTLDEFVQQSVKT